MNELELPSFPKREEQTQTTQELRRPQESRTEQVQQKPMESGRVLVDGPHGEPMWLTPEAFKRYQEMRRSGSYETSWRSDPTIVKKVEQVKSELRRRLLGSDS